jgi:DNA-binding CsgD family transcriptional regulator
MHNRLLLTHIFSLIICLAFPSITHALSFMPVIHNYGKVDYQAALQNWDISQGSNGEVYIGNGSGILCFDGYTWSLTPLPGQTVARSLLMVDERLYVGTFLDFGYMERDKYGHLQYTSLWPKGYAGHDDEIWNIVRDHDGTIYFQSFAEWFSYDGKKVTTHYDLSHMPLYLHEVDGKVFMQVQGGDYYRLQAGKLQRIIGREQVGDDHIVAAVPGRNGHIILCSQWHGLYDYDGTQCTPLRTEAEEALRQTNVNRAALVPGDSTLVVGTILGGIYGLALDGRLKWHYHTGNGLSNNSVLHLMADVDGNVWAALDIGVALINTASPCTLLTPYHSSPSLGMVYAVKPMPSLLYIATNQAAWQYDIPTHQLTRITGSDGQNWHITEADGQLLLGNNEGLRPLSGTTAGPVMGANSSSTCLRRCILQGREVMLESTYYVMRVYVKENGQWVFSHELEGFHAPVAEFEVDHLGNVWVAHMSHGLYRLTLTPDLQKVNTQRYNVLGGDTVQGMSHVMKICGRVVFAHGKRLYCYDDRKDSIVEFTDLGDLGREVCSATRVDDNTFWLGLSDGFLLMQRQGNNYRPINSVSARFFGLDCNDNKNNVSVQGGVAYFNFNNGVGRLEMHNIGKYNKHKKRLVIRAMSTTGRDGDEVPMPVAGDKKHRPESMSSVTVMLSFPNYDYHALQFSFHLTGGDVDREDIIDEPEMTYNALACGDYRLTCQVRTLDGKVIDSVDYYFTRPLPFYARWWAWAIYAAIASGLVYLLVRYRTHKTAEQMRRQYEDKRLQQDMKMLEQNKVIAEQKQQLLEAQLNDKAREAASLALDAAARNQAIEGIRDTLREKRRKGSISQHDMAAMLSQLGESADSDNFWEVYQNNFNLIHKNFFKKLKEQYPILTPTDLRFCALLRLNMSTKDIAQFTGLSVRGVEGARYRLRKKLNLPENTNLVDFLIAFE